MEIENRPKVRYIVVEKYQDSPQSPILIVKGEILEFVKESDPHGNWPNWVFCRGKEKEGWVPKQILFITGTEVQALEDYNAKEHLLTENEILVSEKELNGWIWGCKESAPEHYGWAPLNHLRKL